ncbi:ribonuclease H-like domain-containing protein [Candidatus Aerophobetes bacterium]|nr:ribonuclease H-like domain-containing protein [Candidatus Aerophobetes bacterium]
MLKHTFLHIPGIGEKTERWFWKNNILSWEDYLRNPNQLRLPRKMHLTVSLFVRFSLDALLRGNIYFFKKLLPEKEVWRVYPEFKKRTAFLDIETTGLGGGNDYVTVVGLFDGEKTQFFIQGKNMQDFARAIRKYSVIVTYNGKQFDLPFLEATFNSLNFPQVHIDLRCLLRRLGYFGGLKKIEKILGIKRCETVKNFTGYDAVRLWNKYLDGDPDALKLLLAYNREDVVNLKYLMEFAYQKMVRSLSFPRLKKTENLI